MKLEIRDYHSVDVDQVWNWKPSADEDVYFHLEIEVAETGQEGGTLFQMVVATPKGLSWFAQQYKQPIPDRGLLILDQYSWQTVLARLERIVERCTQESWKESIECLSRYFLWEYESVRTIESSN